MEGLLSDYISALRAKNAKVVDMLRRPMAQQQLDRLGRLPGIRVPSDVLDLLQVFDGTEEIEGTYLSESWLDGTFCFYSSHRIIIEYEMCIEMWKKDADFRRYWPDGFLAIASPGDASRLLVNAREDSPTYGAVYELNLGEPVTKHTDNLHDFFAFRLEALKDELIWVDEDGVVDVDEDAFCNAAAETFPGNDAYDDNLPPAGETPDWLPAESGAI